MQDKNEKISLQQLPGFEHIPIGNAKPIRYTRKPGKAVWLVVYTLSQATGNDFNKVIDSIILQWAAQHIDALGLMIWQQNLEGNE